MQYSVVNYKTVKENSDFRIDAEYFHPVYLRDDLLVAKFQNMPLGEFAFITDGQHGYHEVDENSPISHLTAKNAKNWFADTENADKLAKWVDDKNKRSSLKEGDIILSTRGTVGFCSLVFQDVLPSNIDQDIARIAIKGKTCLPEFLLTYFNSQFGQDWIKRNISGMVQQGLSLQKVRTAPIPLFDNGFQKIIQKIILDSKKHIDNSKSLYAQAEQLLLSELGLLDWKPKHELAFVKNFSATQEAERFDAEYFQPKYEEIIEAVKKYKCGFDELGNLVKIKDKNFTPKDNEQYKYIELANISSNGEINGYTENFGNELPSRARHKVQKGDLIVSSIEGSLESIALLTEDWKNALCSTGFFAVNSDKINSETLLVLLKTKVGQLQLKKGCKGTILTAIGKDELSKIVLPKIDPKTQEEIKKKIAEMYETKKLSKSLLEIAKRGVEMAIEKDEQEAENWIKDKLSVGNIK
ncbi:MAG: restriction endonuclease subunit S [Patescibacteria group bacterium]